MGEKLLRFALEQRLLTLLLGVVLLAAGGWTFSQLQVEAYPDISDTQVVVITQLAGRAAEEVEREVTIPVERALNRVPNVIARRSRTIFGLSVVELTFDYGTDDWFARQVVLESLRDADLPEAATTALGPLSTPIGELYRYTLESDPPDPIRLRELEDWVVEPRLLQVPGIADVTPFGGLVKQLQLEVDPFKLDELGLSMGDVADALVRNNRSAGGGLLDVGQQSIAIRSVGTIRSIADMESVLVTYRGNVPVFVRDIGHVRIGSAPRTGIFGLGDASGGVEGIVLMRRGENPSEILEGVKEAIEELNAIKLPPGVRIEPLYDRADLVANTLHTVSHTLLEGLVIVVAVLLFFLMSVRAALIAAITIPLSLLFAFVCMYLAGIPANLLSLGALDFGIIVDGAVVMVENCLRRLAARQHETGAVLPRAERLEVTLDAAREVWRPTLFGQLIIMVVYLPILTLTGIEGKMFFPMAFTVLAALLGAMLLSITFVPAAVALFVTGRVSETESLPMRWAAKAYLPALTAALRNRGVTLTAAAVLMGVTGAMATRLGSEFLPSLDEGDLLVHALRIPGTSLTTAIEMQHALERKFKTYPEVDYVFSKIGTAEIATDPMPPSVADTYVMLKDRALWPNPRRPKADLVAQLQEELPRIPGNNYEFIQPIQMRFNELIAGVRSDVAVKVFGDDVEVLAEVGNRIEAMLAAVPGASDTKVEQTTGLPLLTINLKRPEMARLGLNVADVQDALSIAVGGREAGLVFEGDRRFGILVRLPDAARGNLEAIKRIPIRLPAAEGVGRAAYVPLGDGASLAIAPGPNQISREDGKRRVVVTANVRGRDIGSFVAEAQARLDAQVKVPTGYWVSWGGTFEQLQSAAKRLQIVVPVSLLLVFMLLFAMFGNMKDGLLVFTGVPFALTGGIVALWLRDIPLSISAGVGFIALSGVAVLNGLVMIAYIRSLRDGGLSLDSAIEEGALTRLRPVLMTALVASLGFVPMAIATGTGAEVQRPLATVVIGGILSSTALTLLVLPVLYRWMYRREEADSAAVQDSAAAISGALPDAPSTV